MIDNFSILLSHGLLLLAFWLLTQRDDLNKEAPPVPDPEPTGFGKRAKNPLKVSAPEPRNPFRKQPSRKAAKDRDSADA